MQVTDPVCNMSIESDQAAKKEFWRGQIYYFCSDACHEKFRAAPAQYTKKPAEAAKGRG